MRTTARTGPGGAVLFQRLGPLRAGEQTSWSRAPERKGLWAFPWPWFDLGYAAHQYGYQAPKPLRTDHNGLPVELTGWTDLDGGPVPQGTTQEELLAGEFCIRPGFWGERERWIEQTGRNVVRRHKFWFSGELFTHLMPNGDALELSQWRPMSATLFADAVRRGSGDKELSRVSGELRFGRYGVGHLEVFIPEREVARIRG